MLKDEQSKTAEKLAWLPAAAALLAFLACNGTIILLALLSLLGISVVINPHYQAAVISAFALLTPLFVYAGYKTHRAIAPLILSAAGAALVIGMMYVTYDKFLESTGLLALGIAAAWNWHGARRLRYSKPRT